MVVDRYLASWQLTPDGDFIATRSSRLLPVRCRDGTAATYAGLSAAWTLGEGERPELALAIAELAAAELYP